MATRVLPLTTTVETIVSRALNPILDAGRRMLDPDRWVLLSCCDWYPDGSSFPTNHAALLRSEPSSESDSVPAKSD